MKFGPMSLSRLDRDVPSHNAVVFATNAGWAAANKQMHNDTEVLVENKGLLNRLTKAGYDKYGRSVELNPFPCLVRSNEHFLDPEHVCEQEEIVEDEPSNDYTIAVQSHYQPATEYTGEVVVETKTEEVQVEQTTPGETVVEETKTEEVKAEETSTEVVKYTKSQLKKMNPTDILVVAANYDIKETAKSKVIPLILKAQG